MNNKKTLLLATAGLLALITTSAFAADIPARMPTKAPAMLQGYNWSGWYLGINGGGGFGRSRWTDITTGVSTGGFNTSGALLGGTMGANWQSGNWVYGLETDLDWSSIKGSTSTNCPSGACETKNSYLGTFRGRFGQAFGRVLPYVTGGLAYGDIKFSDGIGSATETRAGYAVGGGLEWALAGPWTAKVEYLYVDLGKARCSVGTCSAADPFDVKLSSNVVRGGINYRFGPGPY